MWSIAEVKKTGKIALKKNYWGCVLVSLILSILTAGSAMSGTSSSLSQTADELEQMGLNSSEVLAVMAFIVSFALIFCIIWTALRIFLLNPLEIGCHSYLKENIVGEVTLNKLGDGFVNYKRIVLTVFLRDLFLGLWFCLLFIPGVVKSYSYMMVPYILLDDPELKGTEAITRSRQMMNGNKWRAFLMDLSFIGWGLLSLLTCGLVGLLYSTPYKLSAKAALYHELKRNAG